MVFSTPRAALGRFFFCPEKERGMKKYLLMFGLFLLFASNAQAFTCYNGFELGKDADGRKFCSYKSRFNDYPSCHTVDPDVDMYWDMATQKCVKCISWDYSCEVRLYYEDGKTLTQTIKHCSEEFVGCMSCDRRKCITCMEGYTLQYGRCYPNCPTNCSKCWTPLTCEACNDGYTLENGKCVKKVACPANCSECDSSGACTKCADGYELKNGACAVKAKKQIAFCPPDKTLSDDLCCCISK